ncbi:MAG: asparagine synthase (glutamine-hydrolyzing) [Symbiobacteriia bacterium]
MCGIVGWLDWEQDLRQQGPLVLKMARRLTHRGPDDEGVWTSPHAALGHRRLVVVDPAGGRQPMVRGGAGHAHVITYNGELYNTESVRQDLLARGHSFQGHSDTEVLLTAYIEWGPACVDRLNGIFAFGIWSEADQSLFLARDRLGVKPLFYTSKGDAFLFASELKALLAHPSVEPTVDETGLAEVLIGGPGRTPGHGIFKGVRELRPGYAILLNRTGLRLWQYWALTSHPHEDDLETTTAKVRDLLVDTVERQLVADVPVSTLLSGGLDSSAITAITANYLKRQGKGPLTTFSLDYVDNGRYFHPTAFQPDADAPWIERMSEAFGTRQQTFRFDTPELVDALSGAMRARDLPGMADIDSSLYLFSQEIKKSATVTLSGESADEVFGGYPWFRRPDALAADTFPWALKTPERARLLSPAVRDRIKPEAYVAERYREALAEVPRLTGESPQEARRRELFYLNITRFMAVLLDRKDRMSMAAGLEVRVPFCDHRLVEYVWNIPWAIKSHGDQEKGLLRRALTGILPEEVRTRKKSPYPKTHNPNYLAATRGLLLRCLDDPTSPLQPLLDVPAVRALAQASQSAATGTPWFGQLMDDAQFFAYLVQLDAWLREYRVEVRL